MPCQTRAARSELAATTVATTGASKSNLDLEHAHRRWLVAVELLNDPAREAWYELANNQTDGSSNTDTNSNQLWSSLHGKIYFT